MNDFTQQSEQLTPEMYRRFRTALELGKWPDGSAMSGEQRDIVLQALIVYENRHLPPEKRTGYIEDGCRSQAGDDEQPLRFD